MEYRIFPSIGIARLGNSPQSFIGPEVPGSHGRETGPAGEVEVEHFKDSSFRVKKQAARFRIFQRANPGDEFTPAVLPADAVVQWSVRLANKKDAIIRPGSPPPTIPPGGLRPTLDPTRADRLIDSGVQTVEGINSATIELIGQHVAVPVKLGEIRTDADGHLIVLGGSGISASNPVSPLNEFYGNENWHDDVADGPVSAQIQFKDGVANAGSAWLVTAPPDFAPAAEAVVSLYDVIFQLAVKQTWLPKPTSTSFTEHIYPILRKTRSLQWSHGGRATDSAPVKANATWQSMSDDYVQLNKKDAATQPIREQQRQLILKIESGQLRQYSLTQTMRDHLKRWADGTFSDDWTGIPPLLTNPTAQSLTRSQLDAGAGQGFFPGIEAGRIVTDPSIYLAPFDFRIDITQLSAGDMTALMAQPWQADFLDCRTAWWPSQRPDIAPQSGGGLEMWARIGTRDDISDINPVNYDDLVQHVMQLGVIEPRFVAGHATGVEDGRDPAL